MVIWSAGRLPPFGLNTPLKPHVPFLTSKALLFSSEGIQVPERLDSESAWQSVTRGEVAVVASVTVFVQQTPVRAARRPRALRTGTAVGCAAAAEMRAVARMESFIFVDVGDLFRIL